MTVRESPPSVGTVRIGPECFAAADGSVVCLRGRNYVPQDEARRTLATFARLVMTGRMPRVWEDATDEQLAGAVQAWVAAEREARP